MKSLSANSTLSSPNVNSYTSGPYIATTSSVLFPIEVDVIISVGPATPTIYFASRVTTVGGGGGPAMSSISKMIIERIA
jgi:hypothetical protein